MADSVINNDDDCVSFKPNSTNIVVSNLNCTGSHGISVGSLGQYASETDIVANVTVNRVIMSNAQVRYGLAIPFASRSSLRPSQLVEWCPNQGLGRFRGSQLLHGRRNGLCESAFISKVVLMLTWKSLNGLPGSRTSHFPILSTTRSIIQS